MYVLTTSMYMYIMHTIIPSHREIHVTSVVKVQFYLKFKLTPRNWLGRGPYYHEPLQSTKLYYN